MEKDLLKIRCVAVDDEPLALNKLKRNILKFPFFELVGSFHSAEQARRFLEEGKVDLVYIDINMPDINGLEFIRSLVNPPLVIFVTAYPEFAVESYKVSALDFLLKPYGSEDFQRTAEKAYRHWNLINQPASESGTEEKILYLKSDYRYLRVECDNITYIEGQNEYLKINLIYGDPFLVHMTFRQILENLPRDFIQIHRSYIANMKHITSFDRNMVKLTGGCSLPVSESRKKNLIGYMKAHMKWTK